MHAIGIIAEYNPFHKGHAYQAARARQLGNADVVIAVMSGHYTQRGEIAIFDKWRRAQAAVLSGVDLVLELPAVFVVRSAQYFATGGVRLLQSLGIVDQLSFGAEDAEMDSLIAAGCRNGRFLRHEPTEVKPTQRQNLCGSHVPRFSDGGTCNVQLHYLSE